MQIQINTRFKHIAGLMLFLICFAVATTVCAYHVRQELNDEHKAKLKKAIELIRSIAKKASNRENALQYTYIANALDNFVNSSRIQMYWAKYTVYTPTYIMSFGSNSNGNLSDDHISINTGFLKMSDLEIAAGLVCIGAQMLYSDNANIPENKQRQNGYETAIRFIDDSGSMLTETLKSDFQEEIDEIDATNAARAARTQSLTIQKNDDTQPDRQHSRQSDNGFDHVQMRLVNLPPIGKSWVRARDGAAEDYAPWRHLDFGFDQPTAMALAHDAELPPTLFVGGTDDGLQAGGIRTMQDADDDGFFNLKTLTTLLAPETLRIPRALVWLAGDLYILDVDKTSPETNRVYVMRDTNGDGIPDGKADLFADVSICPPLARCMSMGIVDDGSPRVIEVSDNLDLGSYFFQDDLWLLTDTGSGPASYSTVKFYTFVKGLVPFVARTPVAGDTTVIAGGQWQSRLELYRTAPTDVPGQPDLLGSGNVLDNHLQCVIKLDDGKTLGAGDVLELKDVSQDKMGMPVTVAAAGPAIFGIDPASAFSEDWVTLTGRDLPDTLDVYINDYWCETEFIGPESIRFQMPYLHNQGLTIGYPHPIIVEQRSGTQLPGAFTVLYLGQGPNANAWPLADAGHSQKVDRGTTVTLDATGSRDDDGDPLTYEWLQIAGQHVDLSTAHSPNPQFLAPDQDTIVEMMFQLEVDDGKKTAFDMVGVTVLPKPLGDVTQDGKLDSADVERMLDYLFGKQTLDMSQLLYADVNADARLDVADLVFVARRVQQQ